MRLLDDRPLTLPDMHERYHGVELLAARVALYLGEGWTATVDLFKVMLNGPAGEMLRLNHGWGNDNTRLLMVTAYMPIDSAGGATTFGRRRQLNLFLLPSQIAAVIETEILPEYQQQLAAERARLDAEQRTVQARRAALAKMAARLDERWSLVDDTYGPKVVCTRKTKRIFGEFAYSIPRGKRHPIGGMRLSLYNLPPEAVAKIVDVIAGHINGTDKEAPVWLDPDYDLDFDKHITTDPNDDGAECRDMEGNTYPEHAEIGVGVFAAECRRCGAELDPDNDDLPKDNDEH
jgi:hypothetical protein